MGNQVPESVLKRRIDEARSVFDAHREPEDPTLNKKLIINVAPGGSFINRSINPHLPLTAGETAAEVARACNEGATMWHFHPKDPQTESTAMPLDRRVRIHREICDAVFEAAPEIVTDIGGIYVSPPVFQGNLIDRDSILAETRVAPLIDRLAELGPNNRYVEIAIVLCHTAALGGTCLLSFNNKVGVTSDVNYLQSRKIRVELSPFKHSDLQDVNEWVFDSEIIERPVIVDTLLGVHNSPRAIPGMGGFEQLFAYVRTLPQGVLWQAMIGGRNWLTLTTAAIMLGADIVRIGKEDAVYRYPNKDELITDCGGVVRAVATIAGLLGREVATASEARRILGLRQIGA